MLNPGEVKQHRGEIIAYWVSGRREWRDFCRWKQQYRKTGLFGRIAAIIEAARIKTNDIVITNTGVSVNGKFRAFAGESRKLAHINILEEVNPKILQICYQQVNGGQLLSSEIYVPIPKGRLGEAVRVMSHLENC